MKISAKQFCYRLGVTYASASCSAMIALTLIGATISGEPILWFAVGPQLSQLLLLQQSAPRMVQSWSWELGTPRWCLWTGLGLHSKSLQVAWSPSPRIPMDHQRTAWFYPLSPTAPGPGREERPEPVETWGTSPVLRSWSSGARGIHFGQKNDPNELECEL